MCSMRVARCDGCSQTVSTSNTGMGSKIGTGTSMASSPITRLIPGSSQGMVTDKTGGVAAQESPMTHLRLVASCGPNGVSCCAGSRLSKAVGGSGMGYWYSQINPALQPNSVTCKCVESFHMCLHPPLNRAAAHIFTAYQHACLFL